MTHHRKREGNAQAPRYEQQIFEGGTFYEINPAIDRITGRRFFARFRSCRVCAE